MFMPTGGGSGGNGSRGGIGSRDEGEASGVGAIRIFILARATIPVETDGVIARLARLDTILTSRFLLAALDLARLAGPATSATSFLGLAGTLFLRSRHD